MNSNIEVTPRLVFDQHKNEDVPVWEIKTEKGSVFYMERFRLPGWDPVGTSYGLPNNKPHSFMLGNSKISVIDLVSQSNIKIYKCKDLEYDTRKRGWYVRDESFKGIPYVFGNDMFSDHIDDQYDDDSVNEHEYEQIM